MSKKSITLCIYIGFINITLVFAEFEAGLALEFVDAFALDAFGFDAAVLAAVYTTYLNIRLI